MEGSLFQLPWGDLAGKAPAHTEKRSLFKDMVSALQAYGLSVVDYRAVQNLPMATSILYLISDFESL